MSAAPHVMEGISLERTFSLTGRRRRSADGGVRALRGVDIEVGGIEAVGIVGESGSGKSTLARLLLGVDTPTAGEVRYDGVDIRQMDRDQFHTYRRSVQAVFQDPLNSLNPRMTVLSAVMDPLRSLKIDGDREARAMSLLEGVGLGASEARRYPASLSGGQRQRVAIARALAPSPSVLIADEPVSALDVSVQAQILNLIREIRQEHRMALVLVSHDLAVVHHVVDRVIVMKDGSIVESGETEDLFANPTHPYTQMLLESATPMEY